MPRILILLCLSLTLQASDFRAKLPAWASIVAVASANEAAPSDADAWVLLDRTEIAYTGNGEIRQRRFRLVQILTDRGRNQATFSLRGLGGKANKVKNLKGWNLRPDGEMVKVDRDDVVTIHDAGSAEFSTETLTGVTLDRVRPGSLIAFESLESIMSPLGPVAQEGILESVPVRRWELEVAKKEGWFTDLKSVQVVMEKHHFSHWIPHVEELPGARLVLSNLPALPRDEGGHPDLQSILPSVRVRFLDPALETARMWGDWDAVAKWAAGNYREKLASAPVPELKAEPGLQGLRTLHSWMGRALTYKQIYLTPERGWVPEVSNEVGRKRYGDCKDLSCFLIAQAALCGVQGHPVLAAISAPKADPASTPFPVFNHVIAALRLPETLGLPAEVETPRGRFLLVDPTDPLTPLGMLNEGHKGRHVLICLDSGAQWAAVPDAAIQPNRLELELVGETAFDGALTATLQIDETGNAWSLRSYAKAMGSKGVQERLSRDLLELPPTGNLVVQHLGDPLDLSKPFRVSVKIDHPQGFRRNGGEHELVGWGIPAPRRLIQKSGVPRRYPVHSNAFGERVLRVRLRVPGQVRPLVSERSGESPFAAYAWRAEAAAGAGETVVSFQFDHRWKAADFGFEQREAGVQAWKKDRTQFKDFREEVLAFKVLP